ncbi:uncharacterized protein LOC123037502 [Drosophila rhopaloa]|uniref:Uncharacterized protein n=1 Tax=Drosophila rhopaloa TaxID=1041015 RepID=A0ABM5J6P0_DRORH|nr:uncharacterized protein LOC123037502 [Drosophila rhopaloa]
MCSNVNNFVRLVVILCLVLEISTKFEWTNIKCSTLDNSFCTIEYCYIKPINRTYKYVSLKVNLLKTPVTKINFAVYKWANGYLPFLYNLTVDSCRFLKNTDANPIAKFFYELIKSHSNMNHTCPYDHDVIIDKLSTDFLSNQFTNVLPVPEGKYMVKSNVFAYDILRARVDVYGTIS